MKTITATIAKLTLTIATTATALIINDIAVSQTANEQVNLDSLCYKFPFNSRCLDYDYSLTEPEQTKLEVERDSLCSKFPQNSNCLQEPPQVIKIQLDRSGEKDEWVQIAKQDNKIKVKHTTQVKDDLVSGIFDGALSFVPVPLPFVEVNEYNWKNHRVTRITFQPDGCKSNSCTITGTNTLTLPEGTNIYDGLLTVEYQEEKLSRSLTLRVPTDAETETIDSIAIKNFDRHAWAKQRSANYSYKD
ncbi:MAG: hypothetical protein ACRC2S_08965 [Waterburya sp.]